MCICLTRELADQIRAEYQNRRCVFVPHGVDTEYFRPLEQCPKEHILTVGSMLRDWNSWIATVRTILAVRRDVRFVVVARAPEAVLRFANEMGPHVISVMQGVSDHQLLGLYRRAIVLFLPLIDATANNAVVEALSCGVPIVANDFPGVRDYVPKCNPLVRGEPEDFRDAILRCVDNAEYGAALRQSNRAHAVEALAWQRIAVQTKRVYRELATQIGDVCSV